MYTWKFQTLGLDVSLKDKDNRVCTVIKVIYVVSELGNRYYNYQSV